MRYLNVFEEKIGCRTEEEVFVFLIQNLKKTITRWDYFVNWGKVFANLETIEIELNLLNYLIGKSNIEEELKKLLVKYPAIAGAIPVLVASRENKFNILTGYNLEGFKYDDFFFKGGKRLDVAEIEKIILFARNAGFLDLIENKKIKNIVDYVVGVEVGLDSNGRKNRTGSMMEGIVEFFVKDLCRRKGFDYLTQATAKKVKDAWGATLSVDKSSRKIDFAIFAHDKLHLIETNFYGGGGSKLKSTAGEYKAMFDYWKHDGHNFIWVTDGIGWKTTHLPLRETFNHIDCILNLEMVSQRLLEAVIDNER